MWLELRVGTPVFRSEEVLFHGIGGGLMLLPPSDGWLAWFPDFGDYELYVDIVIGVTRTESSVSMIDLDLDVVRRRDGAIELLDVDEFEMHQIELGHPDDVIEHASKMADQVLAAIRGGLLPFDGADANTWKSRRGR